MRSHLRYKSPRNFPNILFQLCSNERQYKKNRHRCDIMDKKIPFELAEKFEAYNNEHILPTFSYNVNSSSNNLSDEEKIVELIILITGFILNVLVLLAIIVRNSMRTSTGCYLLNLVICNFIALLDILGNVVDRWFNLNFKPDVDYINRVTLLVYIFTITVFSVDRYIIFCCSKFSWRITLTEISTAAKGIFIIWSFASIFTAMEFNLYDKFQRQTVINLYIFTTIIYLIMASSIIIILNIIIIIQIIENKIDSGEEKWRMKDSDSVRLLGKMIDRPYTVVGKFR